MRGKHVRECQWVNPFHPARIPCEVALTGRVAAPGFKETIPEFILAPLVPAVSRPACRIRLPVLVSDNERSNYTKLKVILALASLTERA